MTDTNTPQNQTENTEEEVRLNITENDIKEYCSNPEVIKIVKKQLKNISTKSTIKLIEKLIRNQATILLSEIGGKALYHFNMAKFTPDRKLKSETIIYLRHNIIKYLKTLGKEISFIDDEVKRKVFKTEVIDGREAIFVDKYMNYYKINNFVCEEDRDLMLGYNFNNPDLEINKPYNTELLQRCHIQILSKPVQFDYPILNKYKCPQCGHLTLKYAYETESTNTKIKCDGINTFINANGEPKSNVCRTTLYPNSIMSQMRDCYFYDIGYEDDEGNKRTVTGISFNKYTPGFYECVLFKMNNPRKVELYNVIDVKPIESNKYEIPKKVEGENYIFTLQKSFDKYIKENAGIEIYGLDPIKVSLIIQKMFHILKYKLVCNIQIIGDASTGKTTVLKYYGFLLNNQLNLTTNGISVSVAGLRGTKSSILLMGKEQKIVTTGHLGTYNTIHIDEAGENRELVQNLKTFLFEDNYSYDRAGASGVFHKRTSHINISENLDNIHLGQYRGMIRKAYKEGNIKIGEDEKDDWVENWDLHLPLFRYTNPYLRKVVRDKRDEFKHKQLWWIDGYDYALHQRFPLYFYLTNENRNEEFEKVVRENNLRNTIGENLELMRALKSKDLDLLFDSYKGKEKKINQKDYDGFVIVDRMLEDYGIGEDSRTRTFFHQILKISRVLNKREEANDEDFELIKWLIEKTNCKLDISKTTGYEVIGAPNIQQQKEIDLRIEEETKEVEDNFSLPGEDF